MADEEKKDVAAPAVEENKETQKTNEAKEEKKEKAPKEEVKKEEKPEEKTSVEEEVEVEVPKKFKKLVDEIETMSVLELHELVKVLEKKFGVSAAAVAVAGPANGDDTDEEEKSEFTVELVSDGGAKIPTMKVVKELLGLGLKEAKDIVEGVPSVLKEGVKKEEAEEMKKKIEEAGGKVELK